MKRFVPLVLLAALVSTPLAAAATPVASPEPAAPDGAERCTPPLVEVVAACVGPGPCATLFLGPSSTTRCVRVCTTDLVEAVGVCENDEGCLALYTGPSERPLLCASTASASAGSGCWDVAPPWSVCVERVDGETCAWVNWHDNIVVFQCVPEAGAVAASSAGAPCVTVSWWEVCVERDANGNPCVSVWTGMPPSVLVCAPLSQLVGDVCVTTVCVYQKDGALCVGGSIGHPPFEHCLARFATAAVAADAGASSCWRPESPWSVCTTSDERGRCVGVYYARMEVLHECVKGA